MHLLEDVSKKIRSVSLEQLMKHVGVPTIRNQDCCTPIEKQQMCPLTSDATYNFLLGIQ